MSDGEMTNPKIEQLNASIKKVILAHLPKAGTLDSQIIDGLRFIRRDENNREGAAMAEPSLGFVIQGQKKTFVGGKEYFYGKNHCVVIGVDVPTSYCATKATKAEPFLTVSLRLDRVLLVELIGQLPPQSESIRAGSAMTVGQMDETLLEALWRLVQLVDRPDEAAVLAPMIIREIHFRVLMTPLGDSLRRLGFHTGRMKTGTPARVRRSSLDLDEMEVQNGDDVMEAFSFDTDHIDRPSLPCYITYTNDETHRIIRENIHRSPLYGGKIIGKGPRYCPSIEDKVVRFPDRERHQIFVEPEGVGTEEMYLNGLSSSLPEEVQHRFIHSIPGLRHAEIMRPAYAVEYDYLDPMDLYPSLESKILPGLFVAGQTNGTSGYEEAAAQGLIAGMNAAQRLKGEKPVILSRTEAYIGVLIDDLVTKGTKEPYRMFTSRAEYRLSLRHDNADQRLTAIGYNAGLAPKDKMDRLSLKTESIRKVKEILHDSRMNGRNCYDLVRMPETDIHALDIEALASFPYSVLSEAELDIKYEGYLQRQEKEAEKAKRMENMEIPSDFDYDSVDGISSESREKLKTVRPLSIGQASRISGVRVTDIAVLSVVVRSRKRG